MSAPKSKRKRQRRSTVPEGTINHPRNRDYKPAKRRRPGKPTACTESTVDRLCEALGLSMSIKASCLFAGISQGSWGNWINEAHEAIERAGGDSDCLPMTPEGERELIAASSARGAKYVRFFLRTQRAQSEAHAELAGLVRDAARQQREGGDHRAALAILERRHSEDWGRTQKIDLAAKVDAKVEGVRLYLPEQVTPQVPDYDPGPDASEGDD